MGQSVTTVYFLIIAFLVLGFIYMILAFACLRCLLKVFKAGGANFFAKAFYAFMFLTCVSLSTFQGLFLRQAIVAITTSGSANIELDQFKNILLDTVYVPDALFCMVYLSLYWYLLILCEKGYMKSGDFLYHNKGFDPSAHTAKIKTFMIIYLILQTVFVLIYNVTSLISQVLFIILDIGINASIPFTLILAQVYLNIKFSGSISKSSQYEMRTRRINQLTVFCAIMRIPQLALNVATLLFKETIYNFVNGEVEISIFWQLLLIAFGIADFLLSTVIPFQLGMSQEMLDIFTINLSEILLNHQVVPVGTPQSLLKKDELESSKQESVALSMQNDLKKSKHKPETQDYHINYQEIDIDYNAQIKKRPQGLGLIRPAKLKSRQSPVQMMIRQIEIKEVSSYVIDEMKKDIYWLNGLVSSFIAPIVGFTTTQNQVVIVYKHYDNGSLHSILHVDTEKHEMLKSQHKQQRRNTVISNQYEYKVSLAYKIALALEYLHSESPPITHGHLTPHNILFNKNFEVKLSDLGLTVLKKYCTLVIGYTDKSQYSAPEVFTEKGSLVSKQGTPRDVYSFGLILYEIFTEITPFHDLTLKQCQQMIEEQQFRPKLKELVPEPIAQLIQHCWQQDPANRPTMSTVVQVINELRSNIE